MYDPEELHSCRHLIKHKINSGETIDARNARFLRQIDVELYNLYITKRIMYNPLAFGVKKRKSRKMFRKSRKMNRKSKYVKKYFTNLIPDLVQIRHSN